MKFIDVQHPFFVPMYRRVLVVALCLGWAMFEIWMGNPFWGILFGALGLYCAHQFFMAFDPPIDDTKPKSPQSDQEPPS